MDWCPCSLSEEEKNAIMIDKEITQLIREHRKRYRREWKHLLLGTGESGKSTFIKQMRLIHGEGFTEEDRKGYAKVVYQNIFTSIQTMIRAMEALQIPYAQPENVNRMRESLDLFRTILELPWFFRTPIILFLNKTDILEEKIASSDLAAYFPSFPGPKQDVNAAKKFILKMYMDVHGNSSAGSSKDSSRILYPHYTCATDTRNICTVFEDIQRIVLVTRSCTYGQDFLV